MTQSKWNGNLPQGFRVLTHTRMHTRAQTHARTHTEEKLCFYAFDFWRNISIGGLQKHTNRYTHTHILTRTQSTHTDPCIESSQWLKHNGGPEGATEIDGDRQSTRAGLNVSSVTPLQLLFTSSQSNASATTAVAARRPRRGSAF